MFPLAVERDGANRVVRAHRTKLVRHLQIALLAGCLPAFYLSRDDQFVIAAQVDTVLPGQSARRLRRQSTHAGYR